jgi:hypothetical protein
MMRSLALTLAMLAVAPAWSAEEDIRRQALQAQSALNRLTQEQQAVYQQFQMVQELRRNEERLAIQRLPIYRITNPVAISLDDAQREEDRRLQRVNELQAESDRLYARYRELEDQKLPLFDTLASLGLLPPPVVGSEVPTSVSALPLR